MTRCPNHCAARPITVAAGVSRHRAIRYQCPQCGYTWRAVPRTTAAAGGEDRHYAAAYQHAAGYPE